MNSKLKFSPGDLCITTGGKFIRIYDSGKVNPFSNDFISIDKNELILITDVFEGAFDEGVYVAFYNAAFYWMYFDNVQAVMKFSECV